MKYARSFFICSFQNWQNKISAKHIKTSLLFQYLKRKNQLKIKIHAHTKKHSNCTKLAGKLLKIDQNDTNGELTHTHKKSRAASYNDIKSQN